MRKYTLMLSLFAAVSATGCKDLECGDGTIERDGTCAPATTTTGAAMCGPFTELQGDRCVPMFDPTVCDPATSTPDLDPDTGVTTCIGTGGGGCSAPFACPTPTAAERLTVCGQLYDLETMAKFQAQNASGAPCGTTPAASGPCALVITPYDAIPFATNPATATPRPFESLYLDDCGRYRLVNIDTNGTSPFIGLGIDDAGVPNGPAGVTVTVGVATGKSSNVVPDFEAYIVKTSTIASWTSTADPGATGTGPRLAEGFYFASYRAHKLGAGVDRLAPQAGVTFAHGNGTTYPTQDWYFTAAATAQLTIDPAATVTGVNGAALIQGRSVGESAVFEGMGGLGTGCRWEPHAADNIPGVVFAQVYRKTDLIGTPGSCLD